MAHELAFKKDGRAAMAFVGETPWHGLGQSITKGASIGVWAKEAGMDWQAKEAPVLWRGPNFKCEGSDSHRITTDDLRGETGHKVIYRGDTEEPLGVVGNKYQLVQPLEVLEFFRDLTEDGGWHIHTAGVLRDGRKLWAMASNSEGTSLNLKHAARGKGDEIMQNILLATSLDGSMKTTAMLTPVRVVCANTLALATGAQNAQIQVSHRSVFDGAAIKRALGVSVNSFDTFIKQAREMAETPIRLDEALHVLRGVFGGPAGKGTPDIGWLGSLKELANKPVIPDEEAEGRSVSRCLELFAGAGMGADLITAHDTRWGLLNAVSQHVDHELGRTSDTRLDSAWFGRGQAFKQAALKALAPVAA